MRVAVVCVAGSGKCVLAWRCLQLVEKKVVYLSWAVVCGDTPPIILVTCNH